MESNADATAASRGGVTATRRALLAGAGATALAGLAGCLGGSSGGGTDGDGARLAYVRLVNGHGEPHVLHALVQRDGEPVHWSSHDLAAEGADAAATTIERTWRDEPGEFTVYVRLDDADEWAEFTVGDGSIDCYGVEARVTAEGTLNALFAKNPPGCDTATTASSVE